MAERPVYRCSMCAFESPTPRLQLNHLRTVHASDPRFSAVCGLSGCSYSASSFSAFYTHIYRKHPDSGIIRPRQTEEDKPSQATTCSLDSQPFRGNLRDEILDLDLTASVQRDIDVLLNNDTEMERRSSAQFLLKLKEARQVSQVVIDDVVQGLDELFSSAVDRLNARVQNKLASIGVGQEVIEELSDVFSEFPHPFNGLETKHKQEKYYKEKMGLVEPQTKEVGEPYHTTRFTGAKRHLIQMYDTYQYVPFLESLRSLLSDATIVDQVEQSKSRIHNDGTLRDFCDGELFRQHPLFSKDHMALQIIAFYDELELCNPLGTHVKKHKLGIVLFTLGNIDPKFRSSLRVIHLVLAATAPVIEKHGLDAIMEPFVEDLKSLASEGITVFVNGIERTFRGALLAFLADNLASHSLAGFKESFSFALRLCRTCLITKDDYKSCACSRDCTPRSDASHEQHCELVKGPMGAHYSTAYGVNRRSCLVDIPHFSLFEGGLPHDFMHDVLEGVALQEMSFLLNYCISEKFFSVDDYNQALVNFAYEYTETNRPTPISLRSSGIKLHLTAAQSFLLIRILPLLVAEKIPEDDRMWQCFLLLRKFIDILACPVATTDLCGYLKVLIADHHRKFVDIYTEDAVIPKFHYLLHYPEQIVNVGPMERTWTIRHEAKLNMFKRASRLGNFKNIALSLSYRHQRLLCYELSTGKLLTSPTETGPCSDPSLVSSQPQHVQENLKCIIPGLSIEAPFCRATWVKKDGLTFKKSNCYVIIGSARLNPIFGRVDDILMFHGDLCILFVTHFITDYFDDHFHAYVVRQSTDKSYISSNALREPCVLHVHACHSILYIYLKHYFHLELLAD